MILLDLFCGAGGASAGYARAGFELIGVDHRPQPNYPYEFIHTDALTLKIPAVDAIHASPPCQRYIRGGNAGGDFPDLLGETRELLNASGLPWVIENVPGAPMRADALLCGSMFDLPVRRHRWFEFSWGEPILTLGCDHSRPVTGVYGNPHGDRGAYRGMLPSNLETWSRGLGIDWMTTAELSQAIPPAYTELVGGQLLRKLEGATTPA